MMITMKAPSTPHQRPVAQYDMFTVLQFLYKNLSEIKIQQSHTRSEMYYLGCSWVDNFLCLS